MIGIHILMPMEQQMKTIRCLPDTATILNMAIMALPIA